MPKKTTKQVNIAVTGKKQGYWVNKDNLHKGERTIKTKENRHLVKRNRSGYEYDKTITGFEWTKAELQKELAKRSKKGLIEQKSIARDLAHTHRITKKAPIITAEEFFSRDDWFKQDVLGVDTPPSMTLSEIQELYKEEKEETKPTKTYPYGAILQLERSGVDLQHLYYLMHTGRLRHDVEIMRILGSNKISDVFMLMRDFNQFERNRLEELKTTKQLKDKNYLNQEQINQAKEIKELLETKETLYKDYQKPKPLKKQEVKAELDDIDRETANRAFSNTSWSPERRGESARKNYVSHVNEFIDELYAKVPPEQHAALNESMKHYKEKYKAKTLEQLHRHTSLASSAVTGRSNFPVASQRKKNDVYTRKQIEFSEWDAKVQNKIRRDFGLAGGKGISSDDPEVIQKIDAKIKRLENNQQRMKDANKIVRNKNLSKEEKAKNLKDIGFDTQSTHDLLKEDFAGRDGYPSYMLSNNSANIRRLKQRKDTLQQQRQQSTTAKSFDGVRIEDNVEENRLRIYFDEKPPDKIISELKSNGFRWTPSIGAWQRYRSERAEYLAKEIVEDYNKKKEPVKKAVDRSKSIAAGKNLYLEKYDPKKTHLALTKTMTDMQKRRLIKMCLDNCIDTEELDSALKYDENQEIINHMIELNEENMRDERSKVEQKIQDLEGNYLGGFSQKRIKERAIDSKTTEQQVITKEDLIRKRKKKQLAEWEDEPYISKIDVENIDTAKD